MDIRRDCRCSEPSERTGTHGETLPFVLSFARPIGTADRAKRPAVTLCPDRQIGVLDGRPVMEVAAMAGRTTSQLVSDGQDAIALDFEEDD